MDAFVCMEGFAEKLDAYPEAAMNIFECYHVRMNPIYRDAAREFCVHDGNRGDLITPLNLSGGNEVCIWPLRYQKVIF